MQALLHSVPPTLKQATTNPCLWQRLLDIHGQVQVSLLWGHCSFFPGSWRTQGFFVSKANHSQWSKSMPQPVMLKKLKLNSSVKTYKPSRTNTQKRCPFHHRGLECKSRKSRDAWSNRQIWPWGTKRSRSKANRVFPRERTGHNKHPLPTTQEKTLNMDITRWSIPKSDWL